MNQQIRKLAGGLLVLYLALFVALGVFVLMCVLIPLLRMPAIDRVSSTPTPLQQLEPFAVTADPTREQFPSVSPDGKTVAYVARVGGKAIAAGDKAAAQKVLSESMGTIDSIADKKIIHKNKASRHKSRLVHRIRALT